MKTRIFLSTMAIVLLFAFAGTFNPETATAAKSFGCPYLNVHVTNGNGNTSDVTITPPSGSGGFAQTLTTNTSGDIGFPMCGEPNDVNYQVFAKNPSAPNDHRSGLITYYYPCCGDHGTDITLTLNY